VTLLEDFFNSSTYTRETEFIAASLPAKKPAKSKSNKTDKKLKGFMV
jgi:hypothetical protein